MIVHAQLRHHSLGFDGGMSRDMPSPLKTREENKSIVAPESMEESQGNLGCLNVLKGLTEAEHGRIDIVEASRSKTAGKRTSAGTDHEQIAEENSQKLGLYL